MKLHIGQGTTVGAITVFPVWHDSLVRPKRRYSTGAATLEAAEAGQGIVEQLSVVNRGEDPVLVLDGQLFEGGMQHRMATRSHLVPAGATMSLDVACVEADRWHGERAQRTTGRRATTVVRAGYDVGGQHEVWRRIGRYGGDRGADLTGSLASRLEKADVEEQARVVAHAARRLPGQSGVLIGIGGQPLTLEVYDHPATLAEQHRGLLRAAVLDAIGTPALPTPGRRARRLADRLARAELDLEPDVGQLGRLGRARTSTLDATVLRLGASMVHLRATYLRHPSLAGA